MERCLEYSLLRVVGTCALFSFFSCAPCHALTLTEALALAHANDPAYLTAMAELDGAKARSDQAFGQLLPQLSGTASANRNRRNYEAVYPDSSFETAPDISHYNGYSGQLNLTQSVWRHANVIGNRQAGLVVTQSEYDAWAAEQDMLVRLTQAWADFMLAHDAVMAAEQSVNSMRSLLSQAEAGRRIDLISEAKLEEVRSKYEHAMADKVTAESSKSSSRAMLEEIVGPLDDFIPPVFVEGQLSLALNDVEFSWWQSRAEKSPLVASAKQALLAAEMEIRKQRTGHQPTLDLVGSYGRNYQEEGSIPSQSGYDSRQRSIGLQLTVPFYSGGVISAKVREAMAMRNKARQDLASAQRKTNTALITAWSGLSSGKAHYKAASQGIQSAAVALQTAQRGADKGLKFELDVAEAQDEYAQAWYEMQKVRYGMMTNWAKLKAAIGQLTHDDIASMSRQMAERSIMPWMASQTVVSAE